jgi:CRISPR system Cascade subunit CasA
MVMPGATPSLWQTLWANVPAGGRPPTLGEMPLVFPWLAPTVVSGGATVVFPHTASPLQCWWGMPRRIRLDFESAATPHPCGLTGIFDDVHVVSWRQRPHGTKYEGWGRVHPLAPHYQQKSGAYLAVHPQPGGIGYRHWLGLVLGTKDGSRLPAVSISHWHNGRERDAGVRRARLIAAGFDMDNMKARGFVESEMPLPAALDKASQTELDDLAYDLVMAADQVATLLRSAVRNLFLALARPSSPTRLH